MQVVAQAFNTQRSPRPDQSDPALAGAPLLRVENISKHFPGTLALDDVSFDVRASEVHILFGENGAGKSTMIQIIAGVHRPTSGRIFLNGKEEVMTSVHHARECGISAVFQEFSIVPQLTVEENLFLGSEITNGFFLNKAKQHAQACETLERLGFPLRPRQSTTYLSRAEQQMVEIAKAFRTKPLVMILDEPTASLTERETDRLFQLIEILKSEGIGIIYITHRMDEIKRIGDRITVLRDGKFIKTLHVAGTTQSKLVELMTGRVIEQIFPDIRHQPGEVCLEVTKLTVPSTVGNVVDNVALHVRAGEIVGLAGLVGSGKSEIGRACFGSEKLSCGEVKICGETLFSDAQGVDRLTVATALKCGLCYVPADRRDEGLAMMLSVRENMSLSALPLPKFSSRLFIRKAEEKRITTEIAKRLDLSPLDIERGVEFFSGGNQQKTLIGKALARLNKRLDQDDTSSDNLSSNRTDGRDVKVFIFDEPTVGVDVGARALIYRAMKDLCESGAAILLISSDLPEILHLAHRTYVVHRGRIRTELSAEETTEQNILSQFFDSREE